ncbi:MAG TPA: multiubiquitin domain-containing protein [Acidimicrobiales bacterium]|nr:multiubiquitin domain-containing protein [Acidimicrobiales bacterium]
MSDEAAAGSSPAGEDQEHVFHIQIDRAHYDVSQPQLTGTELRDLPPAPIPPTRDLFEVIPGHPDRKIEDSDVVEMHDGLRFFTAPATINPGLGPLF